MLGYLHISLPFKWELLTQVVVLPVAAELTYAELMRDWEQPETATQLYTEILTLLDSSASDGEPEYTGWPAIFTY